ncbi:MAG: hypothetical protein Q4F65_09935 [Propionibacteriaceae bacterium]|nr:hypothetical protein [Propionibacteriaceae bacterium]
MSLTDLRPPLAADPRARVSTVVALMASVLVGAFVLTSALLATLPQFRFESQLPALMPFAAWAGAVGIGHLANLGSALHAPWRAAQGYVSLVPYVLVVLVASVAPGVLPWWSAVVAAASAMVPFGVLAARAGTGLAIDPVRDADAASTRGTLLVAIGLMVLAYAAAGPLFSGALLGALAVAALLVASMLPHGLARASRTWRVRHWAALAWGSLVIWAAVLVDGLTAVLTPTWVLVVVVALSGLPMALVNWWESRRS